MEDYSLTEHVLREMLYKSVTRTYATSLTTHNSRIRDGAVDVMDIAVQPQRQRSLVVNRVQEETDEDIYIYTHDQEDLSISSIEDSRNDATDTNVEDGIDWERLEMNEEDDIEHCFKHALDMHLKSVSLDCHHRDFSNKNERRRRKRKKLLIIIHSYWKRLLGWSR